MHTDNLQLFMLLCTLCQVVSQAGLLPLTRAAGLHCSRKPGSAAQSITAGMFQLHLPLCICLWLLKDYLLTKVSV
jgi:hypothetical protein